MPLDDAVSAGPGRHRHGLGDRGLGRGALPDHAAIFVAARGDTLAFSRITGTIFRGQPTSWDAPVQRVEVVAGYYLQRNLVARVAAQKNWRDGGRVRERTYISGQLSYWF